MQLSRILIWNLRPFLRDVHRSSFNSYRGTAVCSVDDIAQWKDKIDVMILCGGSATDLPDFRHLSMQRCLIFVDSFDTHARIPEHFANVDASAKGKRTCRNYFRWLGPGNVFFKPYVCKCNFTHGILMNILS